MKELEKWIEAWLLARVLAPHSSLRDVLSGVGHAFDPAPREYRELFKDSDFAANVEDLSALYMDWCTVHNRLLHMSPTHVFQEAHNFDGRPARRVGTSEQAAQQER